MNSMANIIHSLLNGVTEIEPLLMLLFGLLLFSVATGVKLKLLKR